MRGSKSRICACGRRRHCARGRSSECAARLRETSIGYGIAACAGMEKRGRVTHELDLVVSRLQRQQGVVGVMLVGIDDGMVIAGDAGPGRDSDTAAALAASLFRRTRTASGDAGLGDARFVRLEADR